MKFALFPLSFLLSTAAAQKNGAASPSPSPTCLCNEPTESSELVIILIATTAFFALTTVFLAAILIYLLIRKLKRIKQERRQRKQEMAECKYWEDPSTLAKTLDADSKQPNVWYSVDTNLKTFHQGGGGKDGTDDTTGSNEVVTLKTKTKNQPKRHAPPPPAKKWRKGIRNKKQTTTAEYEIPTTIGKKKSTYKELDLDQLQPESEYTQLRKPQRGGRTPSVSSNSTSQVKPM